LDCNTSVYKQSIVPGGKQQNASLQQLPKRHNPILNYAAGFWGLSFRATKNIPASKGSTAKAEISGIECVGEEVGPKFGRVGLGIALGVGIGLFGAWELGAVRNGVKVTVPKLKSFLKS
jgi:hypothetical protein